MLPAPWGQDVGQGGGFSDRSLLHLYCRFSSRLCQTIDAVPAHLVTIGCAPYDACVSRSSWSQQQTTGNQERAERRQSTVGKPLEDPAALALIAPSKGFRQPSHDRNHVAARRPCHHRSLRGSAPMSACGADADNGADQASGRRTDRRGNRGAPRREYAAEEIAEEGPGCPGGESWCLAGAPGRSASLTILSRALRRPDPLPRLRGALT